MTQKRKTTAITGAAVAIMAGTAAYMLSGKQTKAARKLKRNATKAVNTLSSVLDGVEYMIGR